MGGVRKRGRGQKWAELAALLVLVEEGLHLLHRDRVHVRLLALELVLGQLARLVPCEEKTENEGNLL